MVVFLNKIIVMENVLMVLNLIQKELTNGPLKVNFPPELGKVFIKVKMKTFMKENLKQLDSMVKVSVDLLMVVFMTVTGKKD
mmetsp:Transcript_11831/g.32688  ORF Transcript_11831/g.32688 Transcript_11831/m.32688 type:complete len:82 (+) Transcript_11831:54-299(+)